MINSISAHADQSFSPGSISVIIPTKNESKIIHSCLTSVFDQSVKPLEVIIVDGRSTDDTLKKARHFPVKIFFETGPASLPSARNLGIQQAKGEILLIMDADIVLNHDCMKHALEYFTNPNVVAVVPSQKVTAHTYLENIQANWFLGTSNSFRTGIGTIAPVQFLRKDVFSQIKFDPRLGYGEDADFHDRLMKFYKGSGRIVFASGIKISAHFPHTFKELWSRYAWYGRTFMKYFFKHPTGKTILNLGSLLMPIVILTLFVVALIFPVIFPVAFMGLFFLTIRNIIACYRSRSTYFIEFVTYEFVRSLFFSCGMLLSLFNKRTGR